jgi:hypothetical protein
MSKLIRGLLAHIMSNVTLRAAIKEVVTSAIRAAAEAFSHVVVDGLAIREVMRADPATFAHR